MSEPRFIGKRMQFLAADSEGRLGLTGLFQTSHVWSDRDWHAECGTGLPYGPGAVKKKMSVEASSLFAEEAVVMPKPSDAMSHRRAACRDHLRQKTCSCGIYSYKEIAQLLEEYGPDKSIERGDVMAYCEVQLYGAVMEHTRGYRSSDCRVFNLVLCVGGAGDESTPLYADRSKDERYAHIMLWPEGMRDPVSTTAGVVARHYEQKYGCPVHVRGTFEEIMWRERLLGRDALGLA